MYVQLLSGKNKLRFACGGKMRIFIRSKHPHFTYLKFTHPQIRILPPAVSVHLNPNLVLSFVCLSAELEYQLQMNISGSM